MRRLIAICSCLGLVVLALAACGSGRSVTRPDPIEVQNKKSDISMYYGQILDWRQQDDLASLLPPNHWYQVNASKMADRPTNAPHCDKCDTACDLADHICAAADEICTIAGTLPGDEWAADKCRSANASCAEAKDKCNKCRCTAADMEATPIQ